jgi:hypothetical protein
MNHLQEWTLMFLLGREREGQQTKGKDLFSASYNISESEVRQLVESGFIAIRQTNAIPSLQHCIGASTIITLTEKGKAYFSKTKPH